MARQRNTCLSKTGEMQRWLVCAHRTVLLLHRRPALTRTLGVKVTSGP